MPDDHSNTIIGATEISLGTDFSGTLDYTLDADIFAINLIAGQTYSFNFQLQDGVQSWLDLDILDAGGNSIVPYEDVLNTSMTFRATTSGTYYVAVRHYEDDDEISSFLGGYTGQVQVIEDDHPTATTPSDDVINPGETVTGTINHYLDRDAARINVEEYGIYRVVFDEVPPSLYLGAVSGNSAQISELWWGTVDAGEEYYFIANSSGTFDLRVLGQELGNYSYTIERAGTDDHSALRSQATQLDNESSIAGNIAFYADEDIFEINGVAGTTYFLTVDLNDYATLDGLVVGLREADVYGSPGTYTRTETQVIFEWTPSVDTSYFLNVGTDSSRTNGVNPHGDYTVTLSTESALLRRGDDTDELFLGTDDAEVFVTLGGNDTVHSGKGADIVRLGDGDDVVFVGGGAEQFHGGAGHDRISYHDSLNGVNINLETNEVSGSWASNDTISGFESVDGSRSGHDVIHGTSGANTIRTFGGDDRVYAGKGNDTVNLGDGNDYVRVGGGAEEFHGGDGNDYLSYYDSRNGVNVNLATNEVSGSWAANDKISGFENVSGSKTGDDTITGTSGANKIKTYGGDDLIFAGGGNDKVYAGKGNDTVNLGDGNDYVRVGGGREEFHGGGGNDYLSYYDSRNGVNVNLATNEVSGSWASNDTISGFENVSGSKTGDDTITGTSGANKIKTYGGDDLIFAGGGDDTVYAGKGNDRVFLGHGDDYVVAGGGAESFDGGAGDDMISYRNSRSGVVIDLQANTASGSWAANDKVKNFENVVGSDTGHDIIFGTSGQNILDGFRGDDRLYGRDGDDWLMGRDGDDQLFGGDGSDLLRGGAGNNTLTGGSGADAFEFDSEDYAHGEASHSVIRDFEDNVDTIRVNYSDRRFGPDLFNNAQQVGNDVVVTATSDVTLTILNITIDALQNDVEFFWI
ncbi:calcium-binding protein [uncultured Shimia sp.]|uniref:calcium-binding protein n=1 Tax=uncultured Shimia sp. TaxID=573152 RepID=UPI00261F7685|nr:calcium-binding protein [uncultured Shimia sp.]